MKDPTQPGQPAPPIFIISGGAGALGKHIARIALSQFPSVNPQVIVIPQVRTGEQLAEAVAQVGARGGTIIHTMVDPALRQELVRLASDRSIPTIDTIGDPLAMLTELLGHTPLGQPGLYQGQHEVYLERIHAIEYTVEHDDGRRPNELDEADVVLTGVSRVGKTPLSIYLSVLGWKVANIPLVKDIPPPDQLFQIDRRRVVGLTLDVDALMHHRRWRQESMGWTAGRGYSDGERLYEELEAARKVFRKGSFTVIDVTNKPIEESADQVIAQISRYFEHRIGR